MGAPAVAENDQITGQCTHVVPAGAGTAPMPFPFVARLTQGLVDTVLIMGRRAAVVDSSGGNLPAHPGLHPSDPFFEPPGAPGAARKQVGSITSGSASVFFGGKAAATVQSRASCCRAQPPGRIVPGVPTVLIG
jgi:uncharacterized Zn-binding protein involved in type VI secretion